MQYKKFFIGAALLAWILHTVGWYCLDMSTHWDTHRGGVMFFACLPALVFAVDDVRRNYFWGWLDPNDGLCFIMCSLRQAFSWLVLFCLVHLTMVMLYLEGDFVVPLSWGLFGWIYLFLPKLGLPFQRLPADIFAK